MNRFWYCVVKYRINLLINFGLLGLFGMESGCMGFD